MAQEQQHEYHLILPEALIHEVQQIADDKHTTAIDLMRRMIKLGLVAIKIEDTPDAALIVREEGQDDREIRLFP